MATRYWVGGNGNWNSTSKWSTSSGGASGASVPTSTDDAVFDSNSSAAGALGVTSNLGDSCANLTINNALFGWNGFLNIYGNLSVTNLNSISNTSTMYFKATSGTKTISMPAYQPLGYLVFDGVGGTWQLNSDITASQIVLTNGTFNSSTYNLEVNPDGLVADGFSSSNSNTRTINTGSGIWTVYGNWNCTNSTNLTVATSTATLKFKDNSGAFLNTSNFYGGGKTWPNVVNILNDFGAPNRLTIYGSNTFASLTATSTISTEAKTIRLESGTTTTITSSLVLSGISGKLVTLSATSSSQATISALPGVPTPATYTTISYSNATGGATFNALLTDGNVNGGNNTGWNFVALSGGFLAFF